MRLLFDSGQVTNSVQLVNKFQCSRSYAWRITNRKQRL